MEKSKELKILLSETFSKKENWDKHIKINGDEYIYISCKNELRRIVHQTTEDVAVMVGCFGAGRFIWCC